VGWLGLARSRIRYPLLANAVQRLLTAMVGQDREEANRLQQAKWELTSRIRDESNVPNAFRFSWRSPLFTRFRPCGSKRGVCRRRVWVGRPARCPLASSTLAQGDLTAWLRMQDFELRNVVAKYPFERWFRFPGSSGILATETIRV
jgi:hypothetical protein